MRAAAQILATTGVPRYTAPPLWAALVILSVLSVVVARVAGPGDMYEKDQPKTLAYTVDMFLNHRYSLPRDVLGQPATKPPLYNWLALAVVGPLHRFDEFAMKWPSIAGTIAVALLCARMCQLLLSGHESAEFAATAGTLAGAIWIANIPMLRLMYLARPDMVQAAMLTGAWMSATIALRRDSNREARPAATLFWICVAGAALAKGPAALFAIAYGLLAAPLVAGSFRQARRLGWEWGLPLALACVGLWLWFAYRQDPQHVMDVLINRELLHRAVSASPEGITHEFYMPTLWFGAKFLPWSALALVPVLALWRRLWVGHELTPALLWLAIIILGLSVSAGKRIDYLLPAYAPGSVLAAWTIMKAQQLVSRRWRFAAPWPAAIAILAMCAYLIAYNFRRTDEAKFRFTDHTVAFVHQVQKKVQDQGVVVLIRGKHPISTLLGQHQGDGPDDQMLRSANWLIAPEIEGASPQLVSDIVPIGFEVLTQRPRGRIALYRLDGSPGTPQLSLLQTMRDQMLTWTPLDNPYRSPKTDALLTRSPAPSR